MRIGIIDIGSNTIKLLVAETGSPLAVNYQTTWETRIGGGIGQDGSELSLEAMDRGVEAVQALVKEAERYRPQYFYTVATSAVRDAANRDVFVEKIRLATGHDLNILSGDEEAAYIAWGLRMDAAFKDYREYCLADLGGGSLELIHINDGKVVEKTSLPLGAVRLQEKFVPNPARPLRASEINAITRAVSECLKQSSFTFPSGVKILAGTGGALSVARAIRAGWLGRSYDEVGNKLTLTFLRYLCLELASLSLEDRIRIQHLSETRADIMPTALLTLITLAETANASAFIHSMHNLRYGLAAKFLSEKA